MPPFMYRRKRQQNDLTTLGKVLFAMLFGLFLVIGVQLFQFQSERHQQREIAQVKQQLDVLATALKSRIYANIFAVSGVKSLVAMNPELTQDDFSRAMAIQFSEQQDLRNIGLARDMVLRLIYPIKGNEAAIGLDYRNRPDQIEAVQRALELNRIVLAGPVALVQGGEGFIARIPIHITDAASGQEGFWGFASVVMNAEAIYAGAGISSQDSLDLSIRGRDGRGEQGEVFFGDPAVFAQQPVTQLIDLPHGSWHMAAVPKGGWTRYAAASDPLVWGYAGVALAILTFSAGIVFLLAENRAAAAELSESLRRFNDLVDRVSVGVYVFWQRANGEMEFEYVSDSWCDMNQIRREDVLRDPWLAWNIVHPDEIEAFKHLNQQVVLERRNFVWEGRIVVDGQVRFALIEATPIFFDNGDSRWFGFEQDISERKQAEATLQQTNLALTQEIAERKLLEQELKVKTQLLEHLSMQDGLTGIANRRYYEQRAAVEWKRVVRNDLPLSLLLIDIDHFKQYNDHYGHGAGDDCLRQVAQALAECGARPLDLVARYGGEEFIALLPETDGDGAWHLAEQMRASVEALAIPHARSSTAAVVTLSIGVATHGPDRSKRDLRQLQEAADQALYRAKHQGRNRVEADPAEVAGEIGPTDI